ncbi:hypothetical protein ACOME3_002444 [Neoechinorhynchus agilis]
MCRPMWLFGSKLDNTLKINDETMEPKIDSQEQNDSLKRSYDIIRDHSTVHFVDDALAKQLFFSDIPFGSGHKYYSVIMLSLGGYKMTGPKELPYVNFFVVNASKEKPKGQVLFSYMEALTLPGKQRHYAIVYCKQENDDLITLETLEEKYKKRSGFDFAAFETKHRAINVARFITDN